MKLRTHKYINNAGEMIFKGIKVLGVNGEEYFVGNHELSSEMSEKEIEAKALKTIEDYKPKIQKIICE